MGQKTHPKAFRLGITQKHLSNWYSKKANYSCLLKADSLIRKKIEERFEGTLTLSNIQILRGGSEQSIRSSSSVIVTALHPRMREVSQKIISSFLAENEKKQLVNALQKKKNSVKQSALLSSHKIKDLLSYFFRIKAREVSRELGILLKQHFLVRFEFVKNTFEDANLIAKFLGEQIKRRVPFRRVIKQGLKRAELAGLKGIKIELSGRLNGIEIARSEWKRQGRVPLHTLNAKIDYTYHFVNTVYGIIGIKVWVYKE